MQQAIASVSTLPGPAPDESLRTLVSEALDNDPRLSQAQIAREIGRGVSSGTLSSWLQGKYPDGQNSKVDALINTWWENYTERRSRAGLPDAPPWVATPTAAKIASGLRYAQLGQDIVVIVGPAGVSKSATCQHYSTIAPMVIHVEMSPSSKGVLTSLRKIAAAMGLRDVACTAYALHEAIVSRLRNTNGLLIVDEAQHLNTEALNEIRCIHDASIVGLALVGNEFVLTRMTGGNRAAFLGPLHSRIGKSIVLKHPSETDIDMLVDAWKLADASCRAQARAIAKQSGGLRVLTKVMRLAASFSAAKDRQLCCDDVRAAARDLGVLQ